MSSKIEVGTDGVFWEFGTEKINNLTHAEKAHLILVSLWPPLSPPSSPIIPQNSETPTYQDVMKISYKNNLLEEDNYNLRTTKGNTAN